MKDNNTWKFSLKRGPEWGEERRERKWKEGGTSEKEQGRKVCQRSTNSSLNKRKKNLLKKNAKILLLLCKSWWNNSLSRWWTLSGEWHLTFTLSEGSIQTSQTLMQPLPSTANQPPPVLQTGSAGFKKPKSRRRLQGTKQILLSRIRQNNYSCSDTVFFFGLI